MKKQVLLYLGILWLLCGCGAEEEIPDEVQNIRYVEFHADGPIQEEEKERQYLEYYETTVQNAITELFEFQNVSVEIQDTDSSCVVNIVIESNDYEQKTEDTKAAVEALLSNMFPEGTEFVFDIT